MSAPCPVCDATVDAAAGPECAACGASLLPVEVAGFWRRLGAALCDGGLLALTVGPLGLGILHVLHVQSLGQGRGTAARMLNLLAAEPSQVAVRFAPFVVMAAFYLWLFWTLSGRSPGAALLKLRVVDRHGCAPAWWRSLARVAALLLALMPAGLGWIWLLFDTERRALHDHLTGTYVVRA